MKIFASLPLPPHVDAVCFDFPSRCNPSPRCVPPSHFLSSIVPLLLCPHSFQTTDTQYSCDFLVLVTFFFFVWDELMPNEVWFSTERHSPTCVSHSHCTGFDKLCKHCVTQHHFRDKLTCAFTLRILPEGGAFDLCQWRFSHIVMSFMFDFGVYFIQFYLVQYLTGVYFRDRCLIMIFFVIELLFI